MSTEVTVKYGWQICDEIQRFTSNSADMQFVLKSGYDALQSQLLEARVQLRDYEHETETIKELKAELDQLRNQKFDGKYHDTLRSDYDMLKAEHERKEIHWGEIKQQLIDKHKAQKVQFEKDYQDCLDDRAKIFNDLTAEVARLQGENEHLEMVVDSQQEFLDGETECRKLRERQLEIARKFIDGCMVDGIDGAASHDLAIEALEREANENVVKS